MQRGLELETQALGPQFEGLADGLSLWAEIEVRQGRPADAERLARRAATVATAPQVKLQHEFAALRWHAHAECDADQATAQLRAFIDAAAERTDPDTLQAMRDTLQALPDALAAYPGCTP